MKNEKQGNQSGSVMEKNYTLSANDRRLLRLVKVAKEIVFREDELLFKELAKH